MIAKAPVLAKTLVLAPCLALLLVGSVSAQSPDGPGGAAAVPSAVEDNAAPVGGRPPVPSAEAPAGKAPVGGAGSAASTPGGAGVGTGVGGPPGTGALPGTGGTSGGPGGINR